MLKQSDEFIDRKKLNKMYTNGIYKAVLWKTHNIFHRSCNLLPLGNDGDDTGKGMLFSFLL